MLNKKLKVLLLTIAIIGLISITPIYANEANSNETNEEINIIETKTVEEIQDVPESVENESTNEEIQDNTGITENEPTNEESQLTSSNNVVVGYYAFLDAASRLKTYIQSHGRLPSYIQVYDQSKVIYMSMPDFLYNSAQFLDHYVINGGQFNDQLITLGFSNPTQTSGVSINGQISSSNFSKYARNIITFMDSNGRAPNYVSTSLGNMKFQTAVYMYSLILDFIKDNNRLPSYVTINVASNHGLNNYLPVFDSVIL